MADQYQSPDVDQLRSSLRHFREGVEREGGRGAGQLSEAKEMLTMAAQWDTALGKMVLDRRIKEAEGHLERLRETRKVYDE